MQIQDYPAQLRLRARYSEVDVQGVVFNAHYLTWFDCALTAAFRDSGVDWVKQSKVTGCDMQLVKSVVEYHQPVHFDEEIDLGARILRMGNSSVTWELGVFGAKAADTRASGEIVWVYTDLSGGGSRPLPAWFRTAAEPLQAGALA